MAAVASIDELDAERDVVATLHNAAGEYRLHAQRGPHALSVNLAAFVAEHRVSRHDPEVGQLREIVDESFSDPVRQIVDVSVTSNVTEGQDGERLDCRPRAPAPA